MQGHTACQPKPALFRPDQSRFQGVKAAFPEGGGVVIFIFFPRGNPVKFTDPDGKKIIPGQLANAWQSIRSTSIGQRANSSFNNFIKDIFTGGGIDVSFNLSRVNSPSLWGVKLGVRGICSPAYSKISR
jgi:hypothetical protein